MQSVNPRDQARILALASNVTERQLITLRRSLDQIKWTFGEIPQEVTGDIEDALLGILAAPRLTLAQRQALMAPLTQYLTELQAKEEIKVRQQETPSEIIRRHEFRELAKPRAEIRGEGDD